MTGYVVAMAQRKGGVGKSTLAAQLAVACNGWGAKTAIVDLDRRGSLVAWQALRGRLVDQVEAQLEIEVSSGWRLPLVLQRFRRDHDVVLIDGPSGREDDFKAMCHEADLVLIPCQPTGLDLWATKKLLADHQDVRAKSLVVLNRMPPRGKAAAMIRQAIERLSWPMARQYIGNRQAYVASMGAGLGVTEVAPSSVAGQEIGALAQELFERTTKARLVA